MSRDPKRLSVDESSGYSSLTEGPVQDTDVLDTQGVHAHTPARAELHGPRNRSRPDPMADLRRTVRESVQANPPPSRRRGGANLLYAVIGTAGVLFLLGVVGVVIVTSRQAPPPAPADLDVAAPSEAEAPADEQEPELDEIDGVPVRRGLRGE